MSRSRNLPLMVILMGIGAAAMLVPAIHAVSTKNYLVARAFTYSSLLFLVLTALIAVSVSGNRPKASGRNQLLTLVGTYTLLPLMLAVPLNEAVKDTTLFHAWWEMVSSITTTGASLYEPSRLSGSLHLWRAIVGWMGGLFVLVSAAAILAPMNLGGYEVLSTRSAGQGALESGPTSKAANPADRLVRVTLTILPVYAGLTLVLWVSLILAGDFPLVAACHAMSTLSTSGISPIGGLHNAASGAPGEAVIVVFLAFALSRRLYPAGRTLRNASRLRGDPEIRMGALIIAMVSILLFLRHWIGALEVDEVADVSRSLQALWGGLFTVTSFLTTTGFESVDWADARFWSGLSSPGLILAGLAVMGGGVATTAGGVKLLRVYALYRHGEREIEMLVHPHSVGGAGAEARQLRRQGAQMAWIFFMLFALSIAVVMLALALVGLDFEQATTFAVAALSLTGPLTEVAGDAPLTWANLEPAAHVILAATMVLGRLETLAIIALLNPEFWRA